MRKGQCGRYSCGWRAQPFTTRACPPIWSTGPRAARKSRAQVVEALRGAPVSLRSELSAIEGALPRLRKKATFPEDAQRFELCSKRKKRSFLRSSGLWMR